MIAIKGLIMTELDTRTLVSRISMHPGGYIGPSEDKAQKDRLKQQWQPISCITVGSGTHRCHFSFLPEASYDMGPFCGLIALRGLMDFKCRTILMQSSCSRCLDTQSVTKDGIKGSSQHVSNTRQSKHFELLEKELEDWILLIHWFYLLNVPVTLIGHLQM